MIYFSVIQINNKRNIMDIEEYSPISTLVVPENKVYKSKFPFVDIHSHHFDMPVKDLKKVVSEMDSLNMGFMVNLSGFRGVFLKESLDNVKENAPTRLGVFVNLDFEEVDDDDFVSLLLILRITNLLLRRQTFQSVVHKQDHNHSI